MDGCLGFLKDLEQNNDIQVLYATDTGSRAWGWFTDSSDVDIRFVFVHRNRRKYLSLGGLKTQAIAGHAGPGGIYDYQGWDLSKALILLQQVNPNIVEFLESPICYLNACPELVDSCRQLMLSNIRILPLLNSYRSTCKTDYMENVAKKTFVNIKKYLYTVKSAAMIEFLMLRYGSDNNAGSSSDSRTTGKFLDVDFRKVWQLLRCKVGEEIYSAVLDLVQRRKLGSAATGLPGAADTLRSIGCVNDWLAGIVDRKREDVSAFEDERRRVEAENKLPLQDYDELFFRTIGVKFS